MYELKDGKLAATIDKPFESAGYIYYYKAPDATTKVILFERFNKGKNKSELELGTFGKSDFGIIKDKDANSLAAFVEEVKTSGQEQPLATALREGREETNGVISKASPNNQSLDIITKAHKCWCNPENETQTIISVAPYELTKDQYEALLTKTDYSLFTRVVAADLTVGKDNKLELVADATNLFSDENVKDKEKGKWRSFTKILLTDAACKDVVNTVLTNALNNPSLVQTIEDKKTTQEEKKPAQEEKKNVQEEKKTAQVEKKKAQPQTQAWSFSTSTLLMAGAGAVATGLALYGLYQCRGAISSITTPELPLPTKKM